MPTDVVSRQVFELALVLFLSFLAGIEREEHKASAGHYVFGGVRSFPLIGFVGYAAAQVSSGSVALLSAGLVALGGMLAVSYWHKVRADASAGPTTEISAVLTYLVGALVHTGSYWSAVALGVLSVLLLELRDALEKLTLRVPRDEIVAFTKFLVLAIVILPVLPNRAFTRFEINPFRTWLVVVVVSALSYASYAAQKWLKQRHGVLFTGLFGGAYSSTATTVVLARRANGADSPRLYGGSILASSGVMYLRGLVLVSFFGPSLAACLAPTFLVLAFVAVGAGSVLALGNRGVVARSTDDDRVVKNPLQLLPALAFGAAFLGIVVLTHLTLDHVGRGGLYALASITGVADVDPFVLGIAQSATPMGTSHTAAAAILIAMASNNVAKGVYAKMFADRATGRLALVLLVALAAAGLVPLAWLL